MSSWVTLNVVVDAPAAFAEAVSRRVDESDVLPSGRLSTRYPDRDDLPADGVDVVFTMFTSGRQIDRKTVWRELARVATRVDPAPELVMVVTATDSGGYATVRVYVLPASAESDRPVVRAEAYHGEGNPLDDPPSLREYEEDGVMPKTEADAPDLLRRIQDFYGVRPTLGGNWC